MKILRIISRILIGIVFVFSGFVKAVDPLGSTYKFVDYFNAFGTSSLNNFAFILGIILSSAEFIIGIMLLFGIRMRLASWGALIFMAIFTPLTLYLAIYNPVSDCGCFGDAVKFSNWQTFGKNIIILIPTLFTFIYRKKYQPYNLVAEWVTIALFTFGIIWFSEYSYRHLPVFNFRPYKIGTNIMEGMKIPSGMPRDEYVISARYQKNGEIKEFDYPNFPDSTWKWVETKNKLVKKGYEPPIHDFVIETISGENITDKVLESDVITLFLVTYDLSKYDNFNQEKINRLSEYCRANNYKFMCLSSASKEQIEKFKNENQADYDFNIVDQTALKTMIRANPGLMLLRKGTILAEWHSNEIPDVNEIKGDIVSYAITQNEVNRGNILTIGLSATLLAILLLFNLLFCCKRSD
jgi:uncharacterized membrane protein YphA (DoxX/SURF4 family)